MRFADVAHMPHAFSAFQSAFHHSAIISFRVRMCSSGGFFLSLSLSSFMSAFKMWYLCSKRNEEQTVGFSPLGTEVFCRRKFCIQWMAAIYINTWINLDFFLNNNAAYVNSFPLNTFFILTETEIRQYDHSNFVGGCASLHDTAVYYYY